jgi:glycosyltransferase involved in cell wall biosynthesis
VSGKHVALLHPALRFTGETERALAIARVLSRRGWRTTLVTRPGSRTHAFDSMAREYGFGLQFCEIPPRPSTAPFAFMRTRRLIAELGCDLIHVVSDSLAPLAGALASTVGTPYVLEIHSEPTRRIARFQPRLMAVAVSSQTLAASVVNQGRIPRGLLHVARHAPEVDPASIPARQALDDRRPVRIGCSGALDELHAIETFVEAVRLLGQLPRPCHFAILGEGPHESALRRHVRELGLADRITIGVPTTPDAAQTLAALDVHVSTRQSGGPGWLCHLALALGVPSILSAVGEAFNLVEDKRSALLFERSNPRQLADAIEHLCANPQEARAMGERARERMRELRPPGVFAREIEALHAAALA